MSFSIIDVEFDFNFIFIFVMQHNGSVVSNEDSQQEGPVFRPGVFCAEFACSSRACKGFLPGILVSPTVLKHVK